VRDAIVKGMLLGPRVLAAGSPITITGGHCHFLGMEADGEAAVRAAARQLLKGGANCLKIMATGGRMTPLSNVGMAQYTTTEIRAAVDEARRAHVTVAAHAIGTAGIRNAVAAGVNTIEHCSWLGSNGTLDFDEHVAAQMAEQGTAASPTLLPVKRAVTIPAEEVSAGVREHIALRAQILDCLRRMRELGVPIVAGTDAGVAWTPFNSLPDEMELLVSEVGLTPLQAVHAATGAAASVLGIGDTVGTLVPGREADLLAVDGDPLLHIVDVRAVHYVMKAGQLVGERLNGSVRLIG
jgi:imidazolonepropionase-like amidohydrolase